MYIFVSFSSGLWPPKENVSNQASQEERNEIGSVGRQEWGVVLQHGHVFERFSALLCPGPRLNGINWGDAGPAARVKRVLCVLLAFYIVRTEVQVEVGESRAPAAYSREVRSVVSHKPCKVTCTIHAQYLTLCRRYVRHDSCLYGDPKVPNAATI